MRAPALATLVVAASAAAGLASAPSPDEGAGAILGRWHGRSTCIKGDWNAACHDEEVVYHFEPASGHPGRILLRAEKIVNGSPEPIYDLEFAYDARTHQWVGEFANERVHVRWTYERRGATLAGRLVDLPSLRVRREVEAER